MIRSSLYLLILAFSLSACGAGSAVPPEADAGSDYGLQLQDAHPGGELIWLRDGPPPEGWILGPDSGATRDAATPDSQQADTLARDTQAGPDLAVKQGLIESITAYGAYYNFSADLNNAPWPDNGRDLTSVPRFASGPCQGKSAGTCHFDTRLFVTLNGQLVESITAYGKGYNFIVDDNYAPAPGNGFDLTTIQRFADGPCLGKSPGSCKFDTRLFVTLNGVLVESITAYGKGYNFDVDNGYAPYSNNGFDLTTIQRFADGPCVGKAAGSCTLDTRVFVELNGVLVESITAYGRGYNFNVDNGYAPYGNNGFDLTTVPRFADGPCAGKAAFSCALGTRTFVTF